MDENVTVLPNINRFKKTGRSIQIEEQIDPDVKSILKSSAQNEMDILNMFYSSFDDDLTTIKARPQNLYIIP